MPTYAVTGAAGCVGRALADHLAHTKQRGILGIDRAPRPEGISGMEWITGDILDAEAYAGRLAGVDTLFHLAARVHAVPNSREDIEQTWRVNLEGTRTVLESAVSAGVRRFVFVSTVAVLSPRTGRAADAYADSKRAAEGAALGFSDRMEVVIARPTTVYGPHDRGNVYRLIRWIDRGLPAVIGNGTNRKSLVFVRNLAAALAFLADRGHPGECYNITDGRDVTMDEITGAIAGSLGRRNLWPSIPRSLATALAGIAKGLGRITGKPGMLGRESLDKLTGDSVFDATPLFALGFTPTHRFDDAMAETVAWYMRSAR